MRYLIVLLALLSSLAAQAATGTVVLEPGWNAVAFQGAGLRSLESSGAAGIVYFDGTAYRTAGLTPAELATSRGYWVYSNGPGQLRYEDNGAAAPTSLALRAGWNLVAFPITLEASQLRGLAIYELTLRGAASPVTRVQPGRAYWVYSERANQLEWGLTGAAADLFNLARSGDWFSQAAALQPQIVPTSDGRSFLVISAPSASPRQWIVSLHGTGGFATDDLALWHPNLEGRDIGLICIQWWLGSGENYYSPSDVYREVSLALRARGVQPGSVMLHGFSRGSANSYAIAAEDAGRGPRYFRLCVASSGGVALDFPPTRAILDGAYGTRPLQSTRWVTAAGARDPNPDRDGIPGMRRTAEWLVQQGATVVDAIEDPLEGHGALMRNPANARRVLDLFQG